MKKEKKMKGTRKWNKEERKERELKTYHFFQTSKDSEFTSKGILSEE